MNTLEIVKAIWPLILIQFAFQVYALYDLYKRKSTRNLSVIVWAIIIIIGEIVGAGAYFLLGRSEE